MVSAATRSRAPRSRTDAASTSAMTSSDSHVGMSYQRWMIIFTPTKARMIARPCCRLLNRARMSASRKYSDRRPMIANAFDVNTMNCSRLTASTAGTESTANSTSVASTSSSTANSGVATRRPSTWVNRFWPSSSSVGGTTRRTTREELAVARVDVVVVADHQLRRRCRAGTHRTRTAPTRTARSARRRRR